MNRVTASTASRNFGISLPAWVFLIAFGATLATPRNILTDQDPYWHIAAGRWIIAHAAVPHHDVFSSSMAGAPWVPHEWLSEVILAAGYDRLGWAGLVVGTAIVFATTLAFLVALLRRYLPPAAALAATLGAWGLCVAHLHARPHVFGLLLLVVWLGVLVGARHEERAPAPAFALLMVLWANLHGGFVVGLVLAALLAGEALFEAADRPSLLRAARGWGLFGGLTLLAAVATPSGLSGLLLTFDFMRMPFALATINEWKSPDFQYPQPLEAWLLLLILGALFAGVRLPVTRIAMLLLLLHEALVHRRFAEILGLATPLLLAPALGMRLRATAMAALDRGLATATEASRPVGLALAGIAIAVATTAVLRSDITNDTDRFAPSAAVQFAKDQHLTGPVFNDYEFGGYLIFSGIAPFVDGRADMYGDAFLKRAATPSELPALLQQYAVAWTLLDPGDARVVLLDHLPGWRRLYTDDIAVVHVRDQAAGAGSGPSVL
jgi:hypothetical protein